MPGRCFTRRPGVAIRCSCCTETARITPISRSSSASSRSITTFSRRIRADTEPPRAEAAPSRCFADDLLEFLHAQALTRVHLLGFSDGANIAMLFALRHPELVEKLILNGGNLSPSGIRPSVQLPIELGYRIARLFAGRSPEAREHAELLGLMVNEPHIPPETLSALTMPVLVLAGTRDMVKRRHTEQIAASLPNAQLQFLNGDHFLAAKEPAAFNEAVLRFLQEA